MDMNEPKILYIDDETDLLELAASFFEDENLPIETCSEFNAALDLIRSKHYDLIISDAKMPSGSGFELLEIIKSEGKFKGKIILVTGMDSTSQARELGFDLIIQKPIKFLELIDQVKELLIS
jgi:DNA-binding response OmpR family regulator